MRWCSVQSEDGIRDTSVTGVQTCALPISIAGAVACWIWFCCARSPPGRPAIAIAMPSSEPARNALLTLIAPLRDPRFRYHTVFGPYVEFEIGRASCRERV